MTDTRPKFHRLAAPIVAAVSAVLAVAKALAACPGAVGAAPLARAASVTRLSSPPGGTAVPVDGRLHGDGYSATVLGVATGAQDGHTKAPPGQTLWVFGLQATVTRPAAGGSQVALTASLDVANKQHLPFALPDPGPGGRIGPVWYRASLPTASGDTVLTITADNDGQSFSLNRMTRVGPTPTASYRSDTASTVTAPTGAIATLPVTAPGINTNTQGYPLPVRLDSATLSYDAPDRIDHPAPSPGQAWLTVRLQSNGYNVPTTASDFLIFEQAVPASAITLTPAGSTPIAAQSAPGGGGDTPNNSGTEDFTATGAFPNTYYFLVPATLTTATLTVTPGSLLVTDGTTPGTSATATPARGGGAQLAIDLPPANPHIPPPLAATAPARLTSSTGTGGSAGGSRTSVWVIVGLLAVVAIGAGAILIARRRRPRALTAAQAGGPAPSWVHPAPEAPGWPAPAPRAVEHDSAPVVDRPTVDPLRPTVPEPAPASPVAPPTPPPDVSGPVQDPVTSLAPPGTTPPESPAPPPTEHFDPPAPLPVPDPSVTMLGPMAYHGFVGELSFPTRSMIARLLAEDGPVTSETLRTDLLKHRGDGDTEPDLSPATFRNYRTNVRNCLPDDAELVVAPRGESQRLVGVTTDLAVLEDALARARTMSSGPERDDLLGRALALIAGRPCQNADFRWLSHQTLFNRADQAVQAAALLLASTGPYDLAIWGCRQAHLSNPFDQTVDAAALTAAADSNIPGALTNQWRTTANRLRDEKIEPEPSLVAHYQRLRNRDV